MGARQLEAGDRKPPAHPAGADDELVSLKPEPALGLDGVCIDEARSSGFLVYGDAEGIDLLAQAGMRPHSTDDLAHARQQPGIIQQAGSR